MINIVRNFYSYAYTCIRTGEGCTENVKVTRGVLQGKVLSPYLFLLFISDFDGYLTDLEFRGLAINITTEVEVLGYADDYVLLSYSPLQVSKKLNALHNYCKENSLVVNINKTKILIFSKSANSRSRKYRSFKYCTESIEVVKSYTYLGIPFANSCSFFLAATGSVSAANIAVGAVFKTIYATRADSWSTYNRLLLSLILSVLFYGVQVWGAHFLDEVEKVQQRFFKCLLALPSNTPGYAVRLETSNLHLSQRIFSLTLNWIIKISKMNVSRLPRQCFESLRRLALRSPSYRGNWFRQIGISFGLGVEFEGWSLLEI